jgi:hypothetical protein
MVQAVSRRALTAEARVRARVKPFVVDKVTLGQVFLRVLPFSLVNIIPPSFSKSYQLGDEQYVR